jgi:DNA primase (bacterial type)
MQASQIEEVIGEFVNLKRAGSNLKGLSPFTDEKTPSFVVSPAKQIFKCFSTGKVAL